MGTAPLPLRAATADDARQGAELYQHGVLHTVLSVRLSGIAGPHVRVICPTERYECRGLTAIGSFLVKAE
jgi:hypothetical protein